MIVVTCQNCGKEFNTFECRKQKFCGSDCWYEYNKKKHEEKSKKKCPMCDKEFVPKYKEQKFCSRKCSDKHQTLLIGENNPHFKQVELECNLCGNKYMVKPSRVNSRKFCCPGCFNKWQKANDEYKDRMTKVLVRNKEEGKMFSNSTMTKPHRIIADELDKMNIRYECEYPVSKYLIDIYLTDYNIMIEVMGDYWHSNPYLQYDISGKVQQERTARDTRKHDYVKENYNVELLYIWEDDIIKNLKLCMDIIIQAIRNKGTLQNYNSFNYEYDELFNVKLKDSIVEYPYRIKHVD